MRYILNSVTQFHQDTVNDGVFLLNFISGHRETFSFLLEKVVRKINQEGNCLGKERLMRFAAHRTLCSHGMVEGRLFLFLLYLHRLCKTSCSLNATVGKLNLSKLISCSLS